MQYWSQLYHHQQQQEQQLEQFTQPLPHQQQAASQCHDSDPIHVQL